MPQDSLIIEVVESSDYQFVLFPYPPVSLLIEEEDDNGSSLFCVEDKELNLISWGCDREELRANTVSMLFFLWTQYAEAETGLGSAALRLGQSLRQRFRKVPHDRTPSSPVG